jgi:DNA-binding MarR family transcriptional regulator
VNAEDEDEDRSGTENFGRRTDWEMKRRNAPWLVRSLQGDPDAVRLGDAPRRVADDRPIDDGAPIDSPPPAVQPSPRTPRARPGERRGRRRILTMPQSLAGFAGFTAVVAAREVEARYIEALLRLDLDLTEFLALSVVAQRPGLSQGALSDRLALSAARTCEIANELEDSGLLKHATYFRDRRKRACRLTATGVDRLEQARAALMAVDRQWLLPLAESDRAGFRLQLLSVAPIELTAEEQLAHLLWS